MAQNNSEVPSYGDSNYYLVDSLNLDELSKSDKKIIDSCLVVYHNTEVDTVKIFALNDICGNMMHDDWIKYQLYQYQLFKKYFKDHPLKKASKSFKLSYAEALANVGMIHTNKGDIPKALELLHKARKIQESIGDKQGLASTLNNIASSYKTQKDMDQALSYYLKSYEIVEEIGFKYGMSIASSNIGLIYHTYRKEYDKAKEYYEKSLGIKLEIGDKFGLTSVYTNLGGLEDNLQNLPEALKYHNKALQIAEEFGNKDQIITSLNNILWIKYKMGEIYGSEGAIALGKRSLKLGKEIGFPSQIRESSLLLYKIYQSEADYKSSLEMYKSYILMRDSINNVASQKAAARKAAQYKYDKQKALDDAENEKKLEAERHETEKQSIFTYVASGGAILIFFFLIFIFNRLQITRKQNKIIEQQKVELSETNEELNQTNEEIAAQRDEIENQKDKVEEAHQEIRDSINYAKRIQNAILPADDLINELLPNSFVLYQPKDVVAGDFYWVAPLPTASPHRGEIPLSLRGARGSLFAAADCTGHGVPGAMVSVVCHNAMNRAVREFKLSEPGMILDKTRDIVLEELSKSNEDVKDGMDIALCSLDGTTLKYAGAHNPLWIVRKNQRHSEGRMTEESVDFKNSDSTSGTSSLNDEFLLLEIKADKQPIGKFDNPTPFTTHEIALQKGDSIYIFSDGYADQFGGERDKKFGSRRFKKLLLDIQDKSMEEQKNLLDNTLIAWMHEANAEQLDDVCVIGIRV